MWKYSYSYLPVCQEECFLVSLWGKNSSPLAYHDRHSPPTWQVVTRLVVVALSVEIKSFSPYPFVLSLLTWSLFLPIVVFWQIVFSPSQPQSHFLKLPNCLVCHSLSSKSPLIEGGILFQAALSTVMVFPQSVVVSYYFLVCCGEECFLDWRQ